MASLVRALHLREVNLGQISDLQSLLFFLDGCKYLLLEISIVFEIDSFLVDGLKYMHA